MFDETFLMSLDSERGMLKPDYVLHSAVSKHGQELTHGENPGLSTLT